MTAISKFYLHDAVTDVSGTLPASNAQVGTIGGAIIVDGTNHKMDASIGSAQVSQAFNTLANTVNQPTLIKRFVSSPIAAQTIASQGVAVSCAGSESNGQSNFQMSFVLALWRPSTGTRIGLLASLSASATEYNTTQVSRVANVAASTAVTAQDGDVLIVEVWRNMAVQGNATARTNTIYYDGTTELSATSDAAYLSFVTGSIEMYSPPSTDPVDYWGSAA